MQVRGAQLATEAPAYGLASSDSRSGTKFDRARAFQNRVAEWVHDGDEPVAVVQAPTGAGKTESFHELIHQNELTLLVYPTNALLNQQKRRFNAENINAKALCSNTLEGHGYQRTENLLKFVNKFAADHEVVVTNPDILQAVIQDLYSGGHAMEFFDMFNSIVYDEFHFYDELAASGILLQTHIITDRNPRAQTLLASATPNDSFVKFIESSLGISIREISATYDRNGDRFRHDVTLHRHSEDRIMDDPETVAELLHDRIRNVDPGQTRGAVIFNSVKDSNEFHRYLQSNHPELFDRVEKDNGFDTNDPEIDLDNREFSVLNTTSKGEVGLDYNIQSLIMETPYSSTQASDFLQRFGRAGRQSEADVHVYGLGQIPSWDNEMEFDEFVKSVYTALRSTQMNTDLLADLIGIRAAYALHKRPDRFNQELRQDFATVDNYDRWRRFIEDVIEAQEATGGLGADLQQNDPGAKLLEFTQHCFDAFSSLRGRSLSGNIKYPRGDRVALTSYDLLTTLRYYDIDHIEDNDTIVLQQIRDGYPMQVTARLKGYQSRPRNFSQSTQDIERELQRWIHNEISQSDLDVAADISTELIHLFFNRIQLTDAIVPIMLRCGEYEIDIGMDSIPTINVERRDI